MGSNCKILMLCSLVLNCTFTVGMFGCSSGYFGSSTSISPSAVGLAAWTKTARVCTITYCLIECLAHGKCRSVVFDTLLCSCNFSNAVLSLSDSNVSAESRYHRAVLQTGRSNDLNNCSVSQVCTSLTPSREIYAGCTDARAKGNSNSGPYYVDPDGLGSFLVWCDFLENDSWAVFQRRLDGSINFYRGWTEYKNGFGDVTGEYWLGLDKIYRLTRTAQPKLNVFLDDFNGTSKYADYSSMVITSEIGNYMLTLGSYAGTAGDSMGSASNRTSSGMKFSTYDRDNDVHPLNCALLFKGAWWYEACLEANLNGPYQQGTHAGKGEGVDWYQWHGYYYSLRTTIMRLAI